MRLRDAAAARALRGRSRPPGPAQHRRPSAGRPAGGRGRRALRHEAAARLRRRQRRRGRAPRRCSSSRACCAAPSGRRARPSCASCCSTARRRPDDEPTSTAPALRGSKAYARRHADELRRGGAARLRRRQAPAAPARGGLGPGAVGAPAQPPRGGSAPARRSRRRRGRRSSTTTRRSRAPAIPAIDLIDFDFPCWHKRCDDLSAVSAESLDRSRRGGARAAANLEVTPAVPRALLARGAPPTLAAMATTALPAPERLLLAAPRGYCAGVDRAVQTVERALELYGAPVYVRKEIVHNKHVVAQLRERGAIFVDELDDTIPEGATTVFSAHGVSPGRPRRRRAAQPVHARRHLPAGDQGPRRGEEVRRRGLHDRPHRPRRPRGGRGHDGRGARAHRAGRDRGRRRRARDRRPGADRLHLPDHAVGRRDARDHQPPAREVPGHHRAAHRRHLLRDDEPPGRRQADGRRVRPRARDRLAELVQLAAPRRRRARLRRRRPPDRQRGARCATSGSRASASSASPPARALPRSSSSGSSRFFRARGTEDVAEFEVMREDVRFMLPKTVRQAIAAHASGSAPRLSAGATRPGCSSPCSSSRGGRRRSVPTGGRASGTPSASRIGSQAELPRPARRPRRRR